MVWAKNARAAVRRVWENEEPRAADRPVPLAAGAMTEAQRDELDAIDPGWCPPWHDPSRCCSWSESDTAHGEACDGFSADTPGRMHDVARTPRRRSRPGRPRRPCPSRGTRGKCVSMTASRRPYATFQSTGLILAAFTRISTSPEATFRSGRSASRCASGPSYPLRVIAFTWRSLSAAAQFRRCALELPAGGPRQLPPVPHAGLPRSSGGLRQEA